MFKYINKEDYALEINPHTAVDMDHLLYFQFVGRLMALAVLHRHFLDVTFCQPFYKRMLGRPLALGDMEAVDPMVHKSLIWMLENSVDDVLDLTFSVDYDEFGEMKTHELKEGGADIAVTDANKKEFVGLMVEWRLLKGTDRQMNALMHGFHEIVPREHILQFTERELEYLICGSRTFDLVDWKSNTVYQGCSESHEVVAWLWEIIESFDSEQQVC